MEAGVAVALWLGAFGVLLFLSLSWVVWPFLAGSDSEAGELDKAESAESRRYAGEDTVRDWYSYYMY